VDSLYTANELSRRPLSSCGSSVSDEIRIRRRGGCLGDGAAAASRDYCIAGPRKL